MAFYVPPSHYKRLIAHSDANSFYASVEEMLYPGLKGKPMAVVGDEESRSGIVLAANREAKKYGVKVADVKWEAKQKCHDIIFRPARYDEYKRMSRLLREHYYSYSDRVEPFGLDECWFDLTGCANNMAQAEKAAQDIRDWAKRVLGLTLSVGLSYNRIFAKLGSDYLKPDATTVFRPEDWKERIYPLPVGDLLMVGRKTQTRLYDKGIHTIGELAETPEKYLKEWFNKWGTYLWVYANGLDPTPIANFGDTDPIKSIGNSQTAPYDLATDNDIMVLLTVLAESVAARMRDAGYMCKGIKVWARDKDLQGYGKQAQLERPTYLSRDLLKAGFQVFKQIQPRKPVRSLGISGFGLVEADTPMQISFDYDAQKMEKLMKLEHTKDGLHERYGNKSLVTALQLTNPRISHFDIEVENTVHPVGAVRTGRTL